MAASICLPNSRRKCKRTLDVLYFSHMIVGIIFVSIFLEFVNSQSSSCVNCEQGICNKSKCFCDPGWDGELCNKCKGKVSSRDGKFRLQGVLYDGSGNYSQESTCSWLLKAEKENSRVHFKLNEFITECIWDHLYIHDGDSAFSPLVAAYSGVLKSNPGLKFKMSSQYVFIHFYSDAAFTLPGFNISYDIDDCDLECSENGQCTNGSCNCVAGWTGIHCDIPITYCPNNCSDKGHCIQDSCICNPGYTGNSCNLSSGGLNIQVQKPFQPEGLTGRASLSLVFDQSDLLFILGGYRMRDYNESNNMFIFNLTSNKWIQGNQSTHELWPRYGHSTVYYKNSLYLYGGTYKGDIVNDFWTYNLGTHIWTPLMPGIWNVTGHTAHIYQDTMLVFFGYSHTYGYINEVMQYNFTSRNWSHVPTRVQGTYAHTSVYDEKSNRFFVYAGYQTSSSNTAILTDKLYSYDPENHEWFKLQSSGMPRYLHSAAILNGFMLTFGGSFGSNTVNNTLLKCFVSDFMLYDIECDQWQKVNTTSLHLEYLDRFGHSMIAVNNTAYIFGGFNSVLLKDLIKITLDSCDMFQNETLCTSNVIKCKWSNNTCIRDTSCTSVKDSNSTCTTYTSCQACHIAQCHWCGNQCTSTSKCSQGPSNCTEKDTCSIYSSCNSCAINTACSWQNNVCVPGNGTTGCPQKPCSEHSHCQNCTSNSCMWCSNTAKCVETNAYVVAFHYAQCMDWTTKNMECQAMVCSQQKTCAECQSKPQCGWCNDETETGTGKCMDGGATGPVIPASCPAAERWSFLKCPLCQCNGHSKCVNGTNICKECLGNTTGDECEECSNGFYGDAKNGGQCSACSCNGQADTCNPSSGECFCRTRGVTGKNCEKCDDSNKYSGNPKDGGTCYYPLNTDFQYTFNLSKREDINFTQINFLNIPLSSDRDVDFTLNCSTGALINITYKSKTFPEEKEYTSMKPCEYFRTKFEHKNHVFGGKENTTFLVYVFNFKTPFMLQISFVQPEKINLLRFFIIFFSCFLSLLLIAAALWKIKHKYDSYRRRQQLIVEMQQMASRPFSTISVEIDHKSHNQLISGEKKDHLDSVLRRRKKMMSKPSAIAIEPLADHKAAILTLFIQLPTGDAEFAPCGQSGLAVGSAFVAIGSHRKQSLEHAKGDKPKIRKNLMYNHPDTCA
ncbi:attractin-like protein 1 isoform X2 [Biomphalaria glabrata]|uniref:Attractin-like protein 1 isoform X2 n=1 Tax=Biomphalaria glabrata TaxID=6526 RepID=A0A9W2ZHM9_BIOGL|nr:attractin-like protein 1 isoform X2 [Biomphalaria glabrata]